jgi:uncharacterized OB-fold protein
VGTYLPPWGSDKARERGVDEDAVTLGVAAARAALDLAGSDAVVTRVILVTRDLPLLEGGNGAALLAGAGLAETIPVVEQIGGAPAALEAVVGAVPGTLVVGVDLAPAGAAAVLVGGPGESGPAVTSVAGVTRSLPVRSRGSDGVVRDYDDPRLQRERGLGLAVAGLELSEKPVVVAGVPARQAAGLCTGRPPALPTVGASSALFALAALSELGAGGVVLGVEQASASAVRVEGPPSVRRDEPAARPPQQVRHNPGPDVTISLAAYERAFESKLRWEAGRCDACGTLALPARYRCLECGSEDGSTLTPLPRTGQVYTGVTVHVPVPGLPTPYSLVIVELDGTDLRALVKVTGAPAGSTEIGDRGRLVFRRVAVRSGIPDYGYALLPDALLPDDLLPDDLRPDEPAEAGAQVGGAA